MQRERSINISNLPPPITIPPQMEISSTNPNQNTFPLNNNSNNHEETNFNRFFFTSRVIPQQTEGYYPFHLSAVLTEHETIRHELIRCRAAIQCLNTHFMNTLSSAHSPLVTCPTIDAAWQVVFLESWTIEYFLPALFIIENNRKKFLIPHYQQLGTDTSRVNHGMDEFILQLTRIKEQIASSLHTLVFIVTTTAKANSQFSDYPPTTFLDDEPSSEYTTSMILQQIRECNEGFDALERVLLPHYDRMEELWPEIIEDKGEIEWEDILNTMMSSNYATNAEQMTILTAANLTCLGCVLDESLRHSVLAHVLHAHYRNQQHLYHHNINSQLTPTMYTTQTNSNKNLESQYNPTITNSNNNICNSYNMNNSNSYNNNHDSYSNNNNNNCNMFVEDIENDKNHQHNNHNHHSSSDSHSNSLTNQSSSLLFSHHRHSSEEHNTSEGNLLFSDTFEEDTNHNNNNNNNSRSINSSFATNNVKTGLNAAIVSPSISHSPPASSFSSSSSPMIVGNTSVSLNSVFIHQQSVPSNYHYQYHHQHLHHKNKKIIKNETPEEVTERDRFTFMTRAYCSANTREEYMLHYPFAFSEFLLRTWDERYLRYQLLLFSICCGRDLVQALDDWRSGGAGGTGDVLGWCNCCVS